MLPDDVYVGLGKFRYNVVNTSDRVWFTITAAYKLDDRIIFFEYRAWYLRLFFIVFGDDLIVTSHLKEKNRPIERAKRIYPIHFCAIGVLIVIKNRDIGLCKDA
jgi:hypothetical protein